MPEDDIIPCRISNANHFPEPAFHFGWRSAFEMSKTSTKWIHQSHCRWICVERNEFAYNLLFHLEDYVPLWPALGWEGGATLEQDVDMANRIDWFSFRHWWLSDVFARRLLSLGLLLFAINLLSSILRKGEFGIFFIVQLLRRDCRHRWWSPSSSPSVSFPSTATNTNRIVNGKM